MLAAAAAHGPRAERRDADQQRAGESATDGQPREAGLVVVVLVLGGLRAGHVLTTRLVGLGWVCWALGAELDGPAVGLPTSTLSSV